MAEVDEILRQEDTLKAFGKGRTSLWAAIGRGEFPAPIKLSEKGRAVGWLKSEVIAWQKERAAKRDAVIASRARHHDKREVA